MTENGKGVDERKKREELNRLLTHHGLSPYEKVDLLKVVNKIISIREQAEKSKWADELVGEIEELKNYSTNVGYDYVRRIEVIDTIRKGVK